jgi:hypothetical protein
MTDWAQVASVIDQVATLLEQRRYLDVDGAIRLLIWGDADAPYPERPTDERDLYDKVAGALVSDDADVWARLEGRP